MVKGVLDLVAGPLEQQQHHGHKVAAMLCCKGCYVLHESLDQKPDNEGDPACCMQADGGCAASFGRWVKVYEKQQEGRGLGASGMHML